jgi:hypothetical protein
MLLVHLYSYTSEIMSCYHFFVYSLLYLILHVTSTINSINSNDVV